MLQFYWLRSTWWGADIFGDSPERQKVALFVNIVASFAWEKIFFYLDFLSGTFTIHRKPEKGGGYLFNSSLPLPPASQTLRQQPVGFCRELTSALGSRLNKGHLRVLKNLSVIERCPLMGGNFKKIVTFGTKCFVRYLWHVHYLGCPLLGGFTV